MVNRSYYLFYCTANEKDYSIDYANILKMAKYHPGVDKVQIVIAISEAISKKNIEKNYIERLRKVMAKCQWLSLEKVFYKENKGQDFSSVKQCLALISGKALADDVITVELLLIFGGEDFTENPSLSDDHVDSNDKDFSNSFPYLASPW